MSNNESIKLDILKFIYFTYFESEKVSEGFVDFNQDFMKLIAKERERVQHLESCKPEFSHYMEMLLKILNCYCDNYGDDLS